MSESAPKNNVLKFLLDLIKGLFVKNNNNDSVSSFNGECNFLSDKLSGLRDSALESDNPLKALMYEGQLAIIEDVQEQILKGSENNKDFLMDKRGQDAFEKLFESKMEAIQNSEAYQDAFQDYHNHDPEFLEKMKEEVFNEIQGAITDSGVKLQFGEQLSYVIEQGSEYASDFMSKVPETPAEKAGIAPKASSPEKDASKDKEKRKERELDSSSELDNGPSMTPNF